MSKREKAKQIEEEEKTVGSLLTDEQPLLVRFGKVILFCLLIVMSVVLTVNSLNNWMVVVPAAAVLVAENAVKTWALSSYKSKTVCYVLDTLLLMVLTFFSTGTFISILYIIILSEFYLSQKHLRGSIAMCACSIVLFLIMFALKGILNREQIDVWQLIVSMSNDIIIISLHFLIFNFTVQIYRKNREITAAMKELNESNEKLRLANENLKEITALEERQRIAKDIHDTAGHSITTVIMQTEAAKLVIDEDPSAAKKKIAAANLQAKHALEELRESVHLLSGLGGKSTLKDAVMEIVHESTDGTGVVIRYDVDDIALCDAKSRFILNTLKEGISNGLRHGGASAFWFELKEEGGRINFLLSDNGAGMELSQLKEGFGLTGMHGRAESLGGNVWFETEPGEGFEIHMTLPKDGV